MSTISSRLLKVPWRAVPHPQCTMHTVSHLGGGCVVYMLALAACAMCTGPGTAPGGACVMAMTPLSLGASAAPAPEQRCFGTIQSRHHASSKSPPAALFRLGTSQQRNTHELRPACCLTPCPLGKGHSNRSQQASSQQGFVNIVGFNN